MTTKAEMIVLITAEVKGLSSEFESDDYTNACNDAARETGWAFPVTTDFKIFWQKQRAKRHLYSYLLAEKSDEFKVRQINLQQSFEHLIKMVADMDTAFLAIQESRPEEFAGVDAYKMFGTQIDAGFQYDDLGKDTTYGDNNAVLFNPTES